ncbi:hypothetical protein [Kitasatospora purpeofusca]
MDLDQQIFLCFFAGSAITSLLVLMAEAATALFTSTKTEDSDG